MWRETIPSRISLLFCDPALFLESSANSRPRCLFIFSKRGQERLVFARVCRDFNNASLKKKTLRQRFSHSHPLTFPRGPLSFIPTYSLSLLFSYIRPSLSLFFHHVRSTRRHVPGHRATGVIVGILIKKLPLITATAGALRGGRGEKGGVETKNPTNIFLINAVVDVFSPLSLNSQTRKYRRVNNIRISPRFFLPLNKYSVEPFSILRKKKKKKNIVSTIFRKLQIY